MSGRLNLSENSTTPATPDSGYRKLYPKSDGWYDLDDAGVETALGGGGSTLPVADTTAIVKGSADATKQVRFEVDGLTTGTTRVVTVPDADLTLTGLTNTQTLTNKTLTTPTIGDLSNATHNHTNAAGGGQLTDAALSSAVGIAKGGTGQTTQTAAFDALSPLTTQGDLLYHNGTNNVRLAKGTANQQIRMNAGATAPEWFTPSGGGSWDYVELRHTASSGTNGGTNTASAWTTLPLDTEVADTGSICTLSSNEFSLPAGTYELDGLHEFYSTGGARIRLYNVTDTAVISTGLSAYAIVTSSSVRGHLMCRFTLGGTKTLRMEYYTVLSSSGTGLGVATGAGVDEIYGIITIRKVA